MSDARKCMGLKASSDCSRRATPDDDTASGNLGIAPDTGQTFRQRAELDFHEGTFEPVLENLSQEEMRHMLHELHVHQIELEMQNEELRRIQSEADEARERYFELYDLAPVGYFTVSENGLILQANLAGAAMLGVSRGALVKQSISHFIEKADQDIFYLLRQQLLANGVAQSCELRMWKKDGSYFWASMAVTVAADADRASVLRVVLTDVTNHKQFEHALEKNNLALEIAREAADKANSAKSEFLSSMSHELRSPLNAVLGFAQLMGSGTPPPTADQNASIDQILKAGWHLLQLINEILDLAAIESRKLTILRTSVSVGDVLQDCQAMMEPQAQKRGTQLTFPRFDKPIHVDADRNRVKQVIINLLSNAIKYGRVGGVVVVQCTMVDSGRLRISVRDDGMGLNPEQLAQLFQPFNRLGQESGAEEGTGIGLVITKELVELMDGIVGAESIVGVGSEFWVELPLSLLEQEHARAPPSSPETSDEVTVPVEKIGQAPMPRRTLLYVEDNLANLVLIEKMIERRCDLKLLSARDASSGIQLARTYRPDVILMDINLPGINGFEALKILHEDPATAHIPVVALSANAMTRDIEKGIQAGFYCYLTKPIQFKEFMAALDVVLHYAAENVLPAPTSE